MILKSTDKIVIAVGGDWQGLYLNGKLLTENHRLSAYDVLSALDIQSESIGVDNDWLEDRGNLPEDLKYVELDRTEP